MALPLDIPPRKPKYNVFLSPEQIDIMINALDGTAIDSLLPAKEYEKMTQEKRSMRQKLVNLRAAIKRKEKSDVGPQQG